MWVHFQLPFGDRWEIPQQTKVSMGKSSNECGLFQQAMLDSLQKLGRKKRIPYTPDISMNNIE